MKSPVDFLIRLALYAYVVAMVLWIASALPTVKGMLFVGVVILLFLFNPLTAKRRND